MKTFDHASRQVLESTTGKVSACVVMHLFPSNSLERGRELTIPIVKPAGEKTNMHQQLNSRAELIVSRK